MRTRSADTEYRFRPDSDFYYLTGLAEPGAVALLRPGRDPAYTLFVRPRDRAAEIRSGRRIGPEGALTAFAADAAHPLPELAEKLPALLDGIERLYVPFGEPSSLERAVMGALRTLRQRNRKGAAPPTALCDARALLAEDRLIKDEAALASLRRAIAITVDAHLDVMRTMHPGRHEYDVEAQLESAFRRHGAGAPGYGSIVGGGANATILHYTDNDALLRSGDLILIDAGAEWDLFSGDLTRTFPISGRFTPAQRDLYEVVRTANETAIRSATIGKTIDDVHQAALGVLVDGLLDLGLLSESRAEVLERKTYERFYMHGTSHWLGADVHDAGDYCVAGKPRQFAAGMVLTVEPGLYVSADDEAAPAELRGTGIRIEDDVLVTDEGPEVLTHRAPKTIPALEALIGALERRPV